MCTSILSANNDTLSSFFPICLPLIFCAGHIALDRTSSTILNRYEESGRCLVPHLNRIALSFFPFSLMLVIGLPYIAFIVFRNVFCIPDLSKTFITKGILLKSLLASSEMIMYFFVQFVYMADYIDSFLCVEPSLHL